ncbi:MAG TPA: hypothetical protein VIK13_05900, partial [Candidatus Limnocylindrales bacterium]
GRAVVTFFGEPIGRVRLKRSGAPAGRVQPEPGRVTPAPGTWTFTLIGGKRETGFRTRSAALRAAVFAYQQIHGEFIEVDVIETTIQAIAAVEAQQVALADARHVRDAVIAEAIAAGVGVRSLARATGMTAARVSQIVAAG